MPDTEAPKVISTVGTMTNLVSEVLQAAVGNHFRDKLQSMPAIAFIEKRAEVQADAQAHITEKLKEYRVETRGVYIQDVVFPPQLVEVLTAREIANQQQQTYTAEKSAQEKRLDLEAARAAGPTCRLDLAKSPVGIEDRPQPRQRRAGRGRTAESYRLEKVGRASAVEAEAEGLAIAKGLQTPSRKPSASEQTAFINVVRELSRGTQRPAPENLALNPSDGGLGGLNALVLLAMARGCRRGPARAPANPGVPRRRPTARTPPEAGAALLPEMALR